ncbi:actin-binding LIM protein 1 isoform X3 [Amyelois transitella]|uniref:actin-binding LIM protein 1 isoform X3 n=1 Tax=Amyelois transitella TaxID=680683 RepID=UPI00298F84D8|nr:actin-binding LIM protein 1 isoform X3 [Amyelois transitella]
MRPKEEADAKVQSGAFILSEKIDDSRSKRSEKEIKKEMKRLEKEKLEREKRERKMREKEKEREKPAKKGKVVCGACGGKCSGEVLRVSDKYFHTACFTCRTCSASLARGGFFCKDSHYYCPQDYQRAFGTRCAACNQYVEGEVVSALGNTYHQKCFTCARCKRAFPSGEKVTYTGAEVVCSACVARGPQRETVRARSPLASPARSPLASPTPEPPATPTTLNDVSDSLNQNECAGCGQDLPIGQSLIALDRQWHKSCFACGVCGCVLQGEYMSYGGVPYCERDYQRLYGVRCAHCDRFVSGRVLQAGENHHYHTACARCIKCGDSFGEGEDMYLHGAAIWHPRCGPPPHDLRSADRASSEMQFSLRSRTPSVNGSYCSPYSSLTRKFGSTSGCTSPGLQLRERGSREHTPQRVTAYSYLLNETPTLRRPLQPYDRAPASPHFHRPPSQSSRPSSRAGASSKSSHRPGMRVLVDSMRSETPRPKSPHMNNEEPIELSHYPAAYKPPPGTQPKIERDDFPAPPYPYTDPERRRRWSDTYKGVESDSDEPQAGKDEADKQELTNGQLNGHADSKLVKERTELSKIQSGIAQVFLKEVKEREKMQQWKKQNLDPRNASRTPSAAREPVLRLRYPSPLGASPSRSLDRAHAHPHQPAAAHSHMHIPPYHVVSSRAAPRPGYGLANRSQTFSSTAGDFTFSGMGDKTHSTDFSSGKSDISAGSITDVDRSAATTTDGILAVHVRPAGSALGGAHGGAGLGPRGSSGGVRRSLPNMATSHLVHEPAKLYPYHLLLSSNYRLPPDCDRLNLERHLSDAEFEAVLQLRRPDFYRLPQWRRHELKRRALLF